MSFVAFHPSAASCPSSCLVPPLVRWEKREGREGNKPEVLVEGGGSVGVLDDLLEAGLAARCSVAGLGGPNLNALDGLFAAR